MTRRILAATDFSDPSLQALREAHTRAASTGAKLAVCHVMARHNDWHTLFPREDQVGDLELEARVRGELERFASSVTGTAEVELFVEQGSDYAEIIRRAEAWSADLVVVGSQGRSSLPRLVLGSVAERVVRYAHCPVLVVRPSSHGQCVLVATDLSDPSLPAVTAGVAEASRLGQRLVVVHALDLSESAWRAAVGNLLGATSLVPPLEVQRDMREALTTMLQQSIERLGATGEVVVLDGTPAEAVVRYAEEVSAGLLVIGTHGRTGLARVALGSVADRILRSAECSVLAVRLAS